MTLPRLPSRLWSGLRLSAAALAICATPAAADITAAEYHMKTFGYTHDILGNTNNHLALRITKSDGTTRSFRAPDNALFEDTAPRLADVDGDGEPEVITVVTDLDLGASLAIYDENGLVAKNPPIGQRFRWLAPIGVADLNGDGTIEIAYVDRPHLRKTLRIVQLRPTDTGGHELVEVGFLPGISNHRIDDNYISGGIRTCNGVVEMITSDESWGAIRATSWDGEDFKTRPVGETRDPDGFAKALDCQDN